MATGTNAATQFLPYVVEGNPLTATLAGADKVINQAQDIANIYTNPDLFSGDSARVEAFINAQNGIGNPTTSFQTKGVDSTDPNDIVGPAGYGTLGFISKSATDAYTIDFTNATTATAPAQQIVITEQLDPNLDWRTFRLTGFGFDNLTTTLSGNQAFYSGLLDYSATKGYDVDVTAGVNVANGLVTWTLQTIDPTTGQAPQNPELGLLPVDDAAGDGEGFVSYTVEAKSTVQTGDTVSAQATVVFDTNAPINTPTITNTIDAVAPTSEVAALPTQTNDPSFEVSWSGTDDPTGSGIASYTIYVSEDGAAPTVWLDDTTRTNAIFTGDLGHTYAFSSSATDNAGNLEAEHATADTTIDVGAQFPVCFLAGTHIRTNRGEVPVERLGIGDLVVTLSGNVRPIVWIGSGRVLATRLRRGAATPVIVRKSALADNVPHRDLRITKAHSLYVENVLIPVEFLVNHRSIVWDDHAQEVSIYHIELETHDVLLANGAPAESYRDDGNRWLFHNANSGWHLPPREPCAPLMTGGGTVDTVWRRVLDRAGPRPSRPLTDDPDLHLLWWTGGVSMARPRPVASICSACRNAQAACAPSPVRARPTNWGSPATRVCWGWRCAKSGYGRAHSCG